MKAAELKAVELYEKDFYRWAIHNADLLSAGEVAKADIQHIAEEIRDMGSRERPRTAQPAPRAACPPAEVAGTTGAPEPKLARHHPQSAARDRRTAR